MPIAQIIPSMNAGELSPLLDARVDLEKYASGCRELQNLITTVYGPNVRRPGTEFIGEVKDSDDRTRLIPFVFSETTKYVVEFDDLVCRFWDGNLAQLVAYEDEFTHEMVTYEIDSPYSSNELRDVQYVQINDLMFMVHPDHEPQILRRFLFIDRILFVIGPSNQSDWPAFLDTNIDPASMITPSGTTGTISLSATDTTLFSSQKIGAYFQIAYARPSSSIAKTFAANGSSSTIDALGSWTLNTYGTWSGTLTVERSTDNGATWYEIRSFVGASDRNISTAGNEPKDCLLRLTFANRTVGTSADRALLTLDDPVSYGVVKLTAIGGTSFASVSRINITNAGGGYLFAAPTVTISGGGGSGARAVAKVNASGVVTSVVITDGGNGYTTAPTVTFSAPPIGTTATGNATLVFLSADATALVINDLYDTTATSIWAEGAWSEYQGYPRAIAAHENRIYYGGTKLKPQSIWGTALDDYQNLRTSVLADAGLFFTIASNRTSLIQWMQSKDGFLHIGRMGSEGRVNSSDPSSALSPGDIQWTATTSYGSTHLPAVILNDALLFVQGQGRKIRSLAQVANTAAFSGQDVTILSEHITVGGIVEYAAQGLPDSILWCIREDGVLLGMSYDALSSIVAWHRHTTQGLFESVCVIPGTYGDEVWFVVKRTVNGATKRFVERFRPGWREVWENEDKNEWWYLDCATRVVNEPAAALVSGLDHLIGETVRVLSDGADAGEYDVNEDGEITLNVAGGINIVGLSYDSIMRPMKLNSPMRNGTSQGRTVKIDRIVLRLLKSLGGKYSTDGTNYDAIPTRSAQDNMDESPPVMTGDTHDLVDRGNHRRYAEVWIKQDAPMPLTVLSIVAKWSPSSD